LWYRRAIKNLFEVPILKLILMGEGMYKIVDQNGNSTLVYFFHITASFFSLWTVFRIRHSTHIPSKRGEKPRLHTEEWHH
jgi:hypothetical protein